MTDGRTSHEGQSSSIEEMTVLRSPADVSAVVCTRNSIASIEACLQSLRDSGVGELIVVDANSTDGTRECASRLAHRVVTDSGEGLGAARNQGIAKTSLPLILNMGSDNVMPPGQLSAMVSDFDRLSVQGIGARTIIRGSSYPARGLNGRWRARFRPGPASVIGTPSLFDGNLLRRNPFNPSRRFSDDSELCETWRNSLDARFAISSAFVYEIGKTSWSEVFWRCRMYGESDWEVFQAGSSEGWKTNRKVRSILHPFRQELLTPLATLPTRQRITLLPFFASFTAMRYYFWGHEALIQRKNQHLPN